jgi:mannan endo-1,4-beta-mannosidase
MNLTASAFIGCRHAAFSLISAQSIPVNFIINTSKDTLRISPFIYGTNGHSEDRDLNITARRLGGNRLTGYNWENNASNMGMDYDQSNSNDNYLSWSAGIPTSQENVPGIVLTAFHDTSLAMSCYSLITLPAAGYVSRDKNGSVSSSQTAPSNRFRQVVNLKGSPLSTVPDTSDGFVYVDEEVNFLVDRYEPALWPSTHPRIHPAQTTCIEVIRKNVALAKAVKSVDPGAEVFGGVFYGFNEQYNMQQAPDWSTYQKYGTYVNAFLAHLHDSSAAAGMRLVDVLDLHWYPDLNHPIAMNDNTDTETLIARLQAPRSLWDSTYVEDGWIGQWFSPVSLLPNIKSGILKYDPEMKIAITEYNYGGPSHISGGIALADVLGIFGKYGVYLATQWGAVEGYERSAFKMYRNYDGNMSTFGDVSVYSRMSDTSNSSVYASIQSNDRTKLHIIAINKNFTKTISGNFTIQSDEQYGQVEIHALDDSGQEIRSNPGGNLISGNTFTYTIPPMSVYHFVVSSVETGLTGSTLLPEKFALGQNYPNPFNPSTTISYSIPEGTRVPVSLQVFDIMGRQVASLVNEMKSPGTYTAIWDASCMASGVYYYRLSAGGYVKIRAMVLIK